MWVKKVIRLSGVRNLRLTSLLGMLFSVFFIQTAVAQEWNMAWDWQVSAESVQSRETPFIPNNEHSSQSVNALLDLELTYGEWLGLFAVKANDLYSHTTNSTSPETESEFIIRELFWQGGIELPESVFGGHYLDITLGKVRLDWGVGYGYRPLDVIKPYRQNPVGIVAEEGAGVASVSMFDGTGEWTLLYSDSSWTSQDVNSLEQNSEQQGIGVRRYNMLGAHEYQWLAYYDDVRHGLLGASIVTVLNDAWELHGSAVYQRQSLGYQIPSHAGGPVELTEQGEAFQGLMGITWADDIGQNIVLEYWFDSRAWSQSEWESAMSNAQVLTSLPQSSALGASYLQGYQHANVVEHNILFHWSLDSSAWSQILPTDAGNSWGDVLGFLDNLTPTFDLMYTPQDGGFIATQWINYRVSDTGVSSVDLELAARFLSGKSDSAYANLPDSHMILLNIKGRF
ncbi:hypothetical protein EK599_05910 [Vibrio sp. T187]|nr:hypothetical protein [Vibrio sp. T187]